jgi:hypothetical protein
MFGRSKRFCEIFVGRGAGNQSCAHWQRSLLSFQEINKRCGRVRECCRIDRDAALDQSPDHRHVALGIDTDGIADVAAGQIEGEHVRAQPPHPPLRLRLRPAYPLDVEAFLMTVVTGTGIAMAGGGVAARATLSLITALSRMIY